MRRKDKEIKEKSTIEKIINEAVVCRIALSDENNPYIVPMNFGYQSNYIYLHSARKGKKIDILKVNNNVCFEVEAQVKVIESENACDWTTSYYSVIGFGKAELIIDDNDEKIKGLNVIMEKYSGNKIHEYSQEKLDKITLIKIYLESISGKKSAL
ncbi:MAG: pyridoxamine 5'-phosphate oxidase family protein [Clostridiales bacterium]